MSVWPQPSYEIPITTQQVTRAAFPNGCLAVRIRDELGELFCDKDFTELFAVRGRPALSPARLALVSVLQFVEGLTDRQAADAVRSRLDWKYLLGLELTDPGFDASVLTEFRSRLAADGQAKRLLGMMLDRLRERGLLVKGGRQRTDATHVIMAARWVNRLEQVQETVRAALEVLAAVAPSWLVTAIPDGWYERYGQRGDDWRLPKSEKARADMAAAVGEDGYLLLEALNAVDCPAWLGQVEAVQILRLIWIQQYYRDETTVCLRDKDLGQPPGASLILSPYDIDARYAVKRGRIWRGYKGHFTETCESGQPHVIVHVTTTPASTGDIETVKDRYADLAAADLLPDEHFVDTGYVSVDVMLAARDDYGIDLIGPLPPDTSWQARDPQAFDLTRFDIDWDNQKVICPNGKTP